MKTDFWQTSRRLTWLLVALPLGCRIPLDSNLGYADCAGDEDCAPRG